MQSSPNATHRRSFLGGIAASAGALFLGRWSNANAAVAPANENSVMADEWVGKIKGTYKQVFDVVGPTNVLAPAFALNFIEGTKEATNAPDSDITAVMVYRYFATGLILGDDVWAKYKLGEVLDVKDPRTSAPAVRNIAREGPPGRTGAGFEQLMSKSGVIIVACNHALTVISRMAAPKASVTPEQAKADFLAGVIPGVHRSASGVYAVNRAQQAGATYCYAATA